MRCWLGPPAGEEDAHGAGITMGFLYTHPLCKSPEGWGTPTPHGPEEELFLLELPAAQCHHQMLPAQAQHPQTSTVLGQHKIVHLQSRGKTLVINHAPLHNLICINLSWL